MDFQKELLKLNVILNNKYFLAVERNRFVGIANKFLSTQKLNDEIWHKCIGEIMNKKITLMQRVSLILTYREAEAVYSKWNV